MTRSTDTENRLLTLVEEGFRERGLTEKEIQEFMDIYKKSREGTEHTFLEYNPYPFSGYAKHIESKKQ